MEEGRLGDDGRREALKGHGPDDAREGYDESARGVPEGVGEVEEGEGEIEGCGNHELAEESGQWVFEIG